MLAGCRRWRQFSKLSLYPPGQSEDHADNDGLDNTQFIDDLDDDDLSPKGTYEYPAGCREALATITADTGKPLTQCCLCREALMLQVR